MPAAPRKDYSFVVTDEVDRKRIADGTKTTQIFLEDLPFQPGNRFIFKKFTSGGEGLALFGIAEITAVRRCRFNEVDPIEVLTCGFDTDERFFKFFQGIKPSLQLYDAVTVAKWQRFEPRAEM